MHKKQNIEQLIEALKEELIQARVADSNNPDGFFYTVEQKAEVIECIYKIKRILNN